LSNVGVGTTPPKAELEPKPASSISTSNTFGAPSGGMTVGDQPGVLLIRFGSIKPAKGGVGVGSTVLSGNWVAFGEPTACPQAPLRNPKLANAVASAAFAVDTNNCRRFTYASSFP
jgi:hypothetical protein